MLYMYIYYFSLSLYIYIDNNSPPIKLFVVMEENYKNTIFCISPDMSII